MLKPGDRAPDFTATAHDGRKVALKDYRGKKVLLYFYPRADTPGCTTEGIGFRDRIADFDELGTVILGASFDTPERNAAFAKKRSEERRVGKEGRSRGEPYQKKKKDK